VAVGLHTEGYLPGSAGGHKVASELSGLVLWPRDAPLVTLVERVVAGLLTGGYQPDGAGSLAGDLSGLIFEWPIPTTLV
jgi:hypothetical protein